MERARNTLAVDVIVTAYFTKDQTFLCCSDPNQLFCWSEHILTSEYKCHGLTCIKLTFELHSYSD